MVIALSATNNQPKTQSAISETASQAGSEIKYVVINGTRFLIGGVRDVAATINFGLEKGCDFLDNFYQKLKKR